MPGDRHRQHRRASTATATLTLTNRAPETPTLSLSPDPANNLDDLTCTAGNFTDLDGDNVTESYAWTLNGVALLKRAPCFRWQNLQAIPLPAL